MLAAARAMAADGDYSKPCRRGSVLGYMHEAKRKAWRDEHLYWCRLQPQEGQQPGTDDLDVPF